MTNEEAFVKYLEIYNFAEIEKDFNDIIDVEEFKKTPANPMLDSGLAYEGSLMFHILMVWHFAKKISCIYENITQINMKDLAKVVVLHQLGKVGMFAKNEDNWQINKLGKVYNFTEKDFCLKTGELSKMLCGNNGISFTPQQYEAMSILDKTPEEYENMSKFRTHISTILKISNDMAYTIARERYKNTLNIK
jgi:hypothetical protein